MNEVLFTQDVTVIDFVFRMISGCGFLILVIYTIVVLIMDAINKFKRRRKR